MQTFSLTINTKVFTYQTPAIRSTLVLPMKRHILSSYIRRCSKNYYVVFVATFDDFYYYRLHSFEECIRLLQVIYNQ